MTPAPPPQPGTKASAQHQQSAPRRHRLLAFVPSWLASAVAHLAALLLLALFTFAPRTQAVPVTSFMVSNALSEEEELVLDLPTTQLEAQAPQAPQALSLDSLVNDAAEPSAMEVPAFETTMPAATAELPITSLDASAMLDRSLPDMLGEVGLDSSSQRGLRSGGEASGNGTTSVFGVKTTGKSFVYVIDNSNSMVHGRLEAAIAEVQSSVEKLKPTQQFYVVFYSDTAYPLLYPKTVRTYLKATQSNKYLLRQWLTTIEHCLHTDGEDAMKLAFDLQPDVIYLLGDGAFTDRTVKQTLKRTDARVVIHTFGFDMKKPGAKDGMESIARAFRGDFHDVSVPPEMLQRERMSHRPRNKVRHGVWGLKLPEEKLQMVKR